MKVRLLVNGPGELWGWARPLSKEMSDRGHVVTVQLLRCPFASGKEFQAASKIPGVSRVIGPLNPLKALTPLKKNPPDLIVQLGGDLLFGKAMGFPKIPLACYSYGKKPGLKGCALVATAFDIMAKDMPGAPKVVGDLVADSLSMDVSEMSPWRDDKRVRLLFFPGSRPSIRTLARDYLKETVKNLKNRHDMEIGVLLSPFSERREIGLWRGWGVTPFSCPAEPALRHATLAVTQPGTNTLELLHRAVPALVAVPFAFLSRIPLSGLKAGMFSLPGGDKLKEKFLRREALKKKFLAWPNRIAMREILPELVGDLYPSDLAREIDSLLDDEEKLNKMKKDLMSLQKEGAPASSLCDALERL